MLPLPFGLDLLEQFRVGPFKIVSKFQPCARASGYISNRLRNFFVAGL